MDKLHFMFYADGHAFVAAGTNLEEDRKQEAEGGGKPTDLVRHVEVEADTTGVAALMAVHDLELNGNRDSTLEALASALFRAGMEYQRSLK